MTPHTRPCRPGSNQAPISFGHRRPGSCLRQLGQEVHQHEQGMRRRGPEDDRRNPHQGHCNQKESSPTQCVRDCAVEQLSGKSAGRPPAEQGTEAGLIQAQGGVGNHLRGCDRNSGPAQDQSRVAAVHAQDGRQLPAQQIGGRLCHEVATVARPYYPDFPYVVVQQRTIQADQDRPIHILDNRSDTIYRLMTGPPTASDGSRSTSKHGSGSINLSRTCAPASGSPTLRPNGDAYPPWSPVAEEGPRVSVRNGYCGRVVCGSTASSRGMASAGSHGNRLQLAHWIISNPVSRRFEYLWHVPRRSREIVAWAP